MVDDFLRATAQPKLCGLKLRNCCMKSEHSISATSAKWRSQSIWFLNLWNRMILLYLWINAPSNNIFRINNNELVIRITSWFPILFFFVNYLPDWFVPFYNFFFLKFVILSLLFRIFYNWWWNEDLIIINIIFNVWYCGLISRL